jgi:hypothetical protein
LHRCFFFEYWGLLHSSFDISDMKFCFNFTLKIASFLFCPFLFLVLHCMFFYSEIWVL